MKFLLVLLFLTGCTYSPLCYNESGGAADLVLDSYKVKEGELVPKGPSTQVLVTGEVRNPQAIPITSYISVHEAITKAGGILPIGNKSSIQVIRNNLSVPKIYEVSWEHVLNLPHESLLMIPGDTLHISKNSIISLLK